MFLESQDFARPGIYTVIQENRYIDNASNLHNNNNNFKYNITQLIEYSLLFAIYMYIAHFTCLPGCTLFQQHN